MIPGAAASTLLALLTAATPAADPKEGTSGGEALASLEAEQAELFARVAPSVVLLVRDGASGSGFVVAPDGLVLTNAHVVGEADEVAVQAFDGRHGRGRVVARAAGAVDLALVRVPFADLPPLAPGTPGAVRAGTFAATVGHGGGAGWTFSTGLVANPRPLGDGAPLLLAQMALRPGSSGGPLVDRLGRAVAVVTAGTRDASGITFAIRVDAAAAAFPQLAGWGTPRPLPEPEPRPADRASVAAASPGDEEAGRVIGVSSFAAATSPAPAPRMVTVWERPTPRRRAAAKVGAGRAVVPAPAATVPSRAATAPAPEPTGSPRLQLGLLAALATLAGAAAARRIC